MIGKSNTGAENLTAQLDSQDEIIQTLEAKVESICAPTASDLSYDNTSSGLNATTIQGAIDELNIEKAPAYTYGTDDLTAGTSALATGTLYFRYE